MQGSNRLYGRGFNGVGHGQHRHQCLVDHHIQWRLTGLTQFTCRIGKGLMINPKLIQVTIRTDIQLISPDHRTHPITSDRLKLRNNRQAQSLLLCRLHNRHCHRMLRFGFDGGNFGQ